MSFTANAARAYIAEVRWQFANTMPQWPHEYTVRAWRDGWEYWSMGAPVRDTTLINRALLSVASSG